MADETMLAFPQADAAWQDRTNPVTGAPYRSARLLQDATGMELTRVNYPAGSVSPPHHHPCAHALIVLEGRLFTQGGSFGPGDVVWYPEGSIGSHGAAGDGPVSAVLVSNKRFAVSYLAVSESQFIW